MTKEELAAELGIPVTKLDALKQLLKDDKSKSRTKKSPKEFSQDKQVVTYHNTCKFCQYEWNVLEEVTLVNAKRAGCIINRTFSHCNKCASRLEQLPKETVIARALQMLSVCDMPMLSQCNNWNPKPASLIPFNCDDEELPEVTVIQYSSASIIKECITIPFKQQEEVEDVNDINN
jgi:hypothetical protein